MWRLVLVVGAGACRLHFDEQPTTGDDGGARDALAPPPPMLAGTMHGAVDGDLMLTYQLAVPPGPDRFLVVSVELGTYCTNTTLTLPAVTYDGVALTTIDQIVGAPCGMGALSAQFGLVAPSVGTHTVAVVLPAMISSIHSGAFVFTGVSQLTPIRASATASGQTISSSVVLGSAPGDLILDTVGQGFSVTAPGSGQTVVFVDNANPNDSLDNAAASLADGATAVTLSWTFGFSDVWQEIATSLSP